MIHVKPNHFLGAFLVISILAGCANPMSKALTSSHTQPTQLIEEISNNAINIKIGPSLIYLPILQKKTISVWLAPYLPPSLSQTLQSFLSPLFISQPISTTARFEVGKENVVGEWVYALVTPFPAITQGVSTTDLMATWQGESVGPYARQPLLMDESTFGMLSALWGTINTDNFILLNSNELIEYAWNHQPAWAIIPFENLEPRWKVLAVDGISPIHKDFDSGQYLLTVPISLDGNPESVEHVKTYYSPQSPNTPLLLTNRDSTKLTILAMTGVTALVRATAYSMETQGITYPSQDIRNILQNADLTHISNEVPFAENCPEPDPFQIAVKFCSQDNYIELLEDVGTDILELSGDHFQDWGSEAVLHTLNLYNERGWHYYGGGANLTEGRQALVLEHNQNKLAFIGCNAKGASFAQASDTNPGAAVCDMEWMTSEINRLKQDGYLPIATFQHQEYYTYMAQPDQQRDFRMMADAGAVIVSGSQAHQPQSIEFLDDAFIHYGLGNLFFDQYDLNAACRQGVIDLHVFYDGRYINTELSPIQFIDYARSRPMTNDEADNFFLVLFQSSGW